MRQVGLTVLVLGALIAGCHDPGKVRPVDTTAIFEQDALDFGEVPVGEWREARLTVRNVGYVPFTLLEALKLDENPSFHVDAPMTRVPSGEAREVVVRFHPTAEGPVEDRVRVNLDARHRPENPIPVRGIGVQTVIGLSTRDLDFEVLEKDSERTLNLKITNPVDLPLELTVAGGAAAEYGTNTTTIGPNETVDLSTRFAPSVLGARHARLEIRSCAGCTPTVVNLSGLSVEHAFSFKPAPVPFPQTPVHSSTESYTQMTNIIWRPVTIRELVADDPAFSALTDVKDRVLNPGESIKVDMKFAARFSGQNAGNMNVRYQSDRHREAQLALDASGGSPQLALTPVDIDFGRLPVGGKLERLVRLTNAGTTGNLHVRGLRADGSGLQFGAGAPRRIDGTRLAWDAASAWPALRAADLPLAPGTDAIDVPIYFNPTAPGTFEATLYFQTDDMFNPERVVRVRGEAWDAGVCRGRIVPVPQLDFGNVPPGEWAVLGFRFENMGTDVCAVKDIRLSNTGGGVFTMPGGELTGGVVLQDDAFSAMIGFHSDIPGVFHGELELFVNDPANPRLTLPITAVSTGSCLSAAPPLLDFGPIRYDCAPQPRKTYVSNICAAPITVGVPRIGEGTSSQFRIVQAPTTATTLAPGQGIEVEVTYDRTVLGQHYSPLFIDSPTEAAPFLIPMWAETNHVGATTDRFVQGNANQLDVLFVVSNTTTMQTFQRRLAADMPGWISAAQSAGLDLQVGVTTTGLVERTGACLGGANGGEAGRLFPADGSRARILPGVPAQVGTLQQNLSVGACHNLVQGLETMRMALSAPLIDRADDPRTPMANDGNLGLLRPAARLAVIFVADEDDNSGFSPDSYVQFLQTLKGPNMGHRVQAYAIVPDALCGAGSTAGPDGARFTQVARNTGGETISICRSSYASLLNNVLQRANGAQQDFRLSFPLRSAGEATVFVDGVQVPSSAWTYDAATQSIVFAPGSVPAQGQTVEVRYVGDCSVVPQ